MGIASSSSTRSNIHNAFERAGASAVEHGDENDLCWCCLPSLAPPSSSQSPNACPNIQTLPQPKKLLWGCSNAEEHYNYIIDACSRVKKLHGEDGLRELGLVYREFGVGDDSDSREKHGKGSAEQSPVQLPVHCVEDEEEWCESSFSDESGHSQQHLNCEAEYLVPLGTSLKDSCHLQGIGTTLTASPSSVSLFSLATHHTFSTEDREGIEEPYVGRALRLFRVFPPPLDRPPILIEAGNHESFIATGKMYEEVSRLCMEHAQTIMMREGQLCWVTICQERRIRALVSRARSTNYARRGRVLLVVTGKGKVWAGIFSRRHMMTLGIEAGTALPMVREAVRRDMDIVILDPNVNGDENGMDTVGASLRHLFPTAAANHDEIFIVAHSAAGAQIVRYLLGSQQAGTSVDPNTMEEGRAFGRLIRAIVFTDSNHNINWAKKDPELTKMLAGPTCLYVKAHKLHDEPKGLGEPVDGCDFWRHRFGDIRTIWAGTCEHSLTNYIPRYHIWDHFDSFIDW